MIKKIVFVLLALFCVKGFSQTQTDSLLKAHERVLKEHDKTFSNLLDSINKIKIRVEHFSEDLALTGTRIVSNEERTVEAPKLTIGGYVSTYFAWYSDTADANKFQKFPTTAPQSQAFSLNLAQISAKYSSNSLRAITVLHFGDMPRSVWSPVYNYVQEANAGIRLFRKVWLDAGFFRTHIGLESIQPRENIASGVAVLTFFEPYYMSGAKLSFLASDKLTLQVNAFNSYNGFTEHNLKKAVGLSCIYDLSSKLSVTFNSLWNDDSPDTSKLQSGRLYNNLYMIYKTRKLTLGLEANYGFQQNTSLDPAAPRKTAQMFSALAEAKYMLVKKLFIYGRAEYFNDQDEMLTGPEVNQNKQLVGLTVGGATLGIEYKPLQNTYFRIEGRELETQGDKEEIFFYNGRSSNVRYEFMCSLGVWF